MHGKSIDDTPGTPYNVTPSRSSAMDPTNFHRERGLSGFDIRDRLVMSPVYQLPFGTGRTFMRSGLAGRLIGGWDLSGTGLARGRRPSGIGGATRARSAG